MTYIESPTNPRVKSIVRLRNRRERDETRAFVIEGVAEVEKALDSHVECLELFATHDVSESLLETAEGLGIRAFRVSDEAFGKMAYRSTGALVVARQFDTSLERMPSGSLYLVTEAIEKPGNLGTMIRTAEAAGVDGVIICDPTTDVFNPNVVRASVGTMLWMPLAVASSSEIVQWCQSHGIQTVAATPDAELRYDQADLRPPTAVVVGAEHDGLSADWMASADMAVTIPMLGHGDSLNAATSAAVILFESVRQRS